MTPPLLESRCTGCHRPIEPSPYGWTLIDRGEHIDDPRACLTGHEHAPEEAS